MSVVAPIPVLEASIPDPQVVAEKRAELEAAGVEYVLSCWIDLQGIPKTKPIPLSSWEALCAGRGPQFAVHSVSMVPERGPADADQVAIPDLDSLVICPWEPRYAWVFADLFWEGQSYDVCPRSALKREIARAAMLGYEFLAGIEPEFIIMRYYEGRPVKGLDDDPLSPGGLRPRRQGFGYDAEFSLDSMRFLGELGELVGQLGWSLSNMVAEGAYSQFELDFGHADLLTTADRFTFLRVLLKEVAKRHGCFVTYMAKPTQGDWRSGAHINHSVRRGDDPDVNLFEGEDGTWGRPAYQSVSGLMRHAQAMCAVTCPTVNSYKGLIARASGFEGGTVTWAPTHVSYGPNNRSTMFRFPQARWAIENRAADMCMNAYLALALTAAASLEGIQTNAEPGSPVDTEVYAMTARELSEAGVHPLPPTLLHAVEAFERDKVAREVLGATMHDSYSRLKREEWNRFHEHVSEWEVAEYLRFF